MRKGGGKQKGGSFERKCCVALSRFVTRGKRKDVFWRTAMSGGRATVVGIDVRQAGDITAVAHEGYLFANRYICECKHVKNLQLSRFLLENKGGRDSIKAYWKKLTKECDLRKRLPMLIACQNRMPTIVVLRNTDPLVLGIERITSQTEGYSVGLFSDLLKQRWHEFTWET